MSYQYEKSWFDVFAEEFPFRKWMNYFVSKEELCGTFNTDLTIKKWLHTGKEEIQYFVPLFEAVSAVCEKRGTPLEFHVFCAALGVPIAKVKKLVPDDATVIPGGWFELMTYQTVQSGFKFFQDHGFSRAEYYLLLRALRCMPTVMENVAKRITTEDKEIERQQSQEERCKSFTVNLTIGTWLHNGKEELRYFVPLFETVSALCDKKGTSLEFQVFCAALGIPIDKAKKLAPDGSVVSRCVWTTSFFEFIAYRTVQADYYCTSGFKYFQDNAGFTRTEYYLLLEAFRYMPTVMETVNKRIAKEKDDEEKERLRNSMSYNAFHKPKTNNW